MLNTTALNALNASSAAYICTLHRKLFMNTFYSNKINHSEILTKHKHIYISVHAYVYRYKFRIPNSIVWQPQLDWLMFHSKVKKTLFSHSENYFHILVEFQKICYGIRYAHVGYYFIQNEIKLYLSSLANPT